MRPSLWIGRRRAPTPPPTGPIDTDVVVVGAGIAGLTAGLELARSGREVVVLESRRLGSGATGFTSAKVSVLQGTRLHRLLRDHGPDVARAYATANLEAADWITARVERDGIDCDWERRPALTWTTDPAEVATVEAEVTAGGRLGLDTRLVTSTDLPFEVAAGVQLDDQAQFDPVAYLNGLADALEAAGGTIHEGTRVHGLSAEDGAVSLTTDGSSVRAGHVLVCTGIPFVDRSLFFARLEPKRSYVVAVRTPGPVPRSMSLSAGEPTRSLRTARDDDGAEVLLVGGAGHTVGRRADADGAYEELDDWADAVFGPHEVVARWSTQDYVPVDGLPYVGTAWGLPDRAQVATGFAKWGMTNGTAAGLLMAGAVQGTPPAWGPPFTAGRLGPARSLPGLVKLNAEVAGRFAADRLRPPGGRPDLAEGEGRVVRRGLRLTAVSNAEGVTREVAAVCPHLGGVLAWNPAERTWDCPLHGSRFAPDGSLLQGPAVDDLEGR